MVLKIVKIESTLFEFVDGYLSFALGVDIPIEVELPSGDGLGQVAIFVAERDTQLYDL